MYMYQIKDRLQDGRKQLPASTNARQDLVKTLQASIYDKAEAEAKRRKLNPTNSGAGADQKAINREVELANQTDLMHNGIHQREPRANIKRECIFDVTSQGNKVTKRENEPSSASLERASLDVRVGFA